MPSSLGLILSSAIMLVLAAAATAEEIGYNESKPIGMVSRSLREVEETFVKVLGQYGKVYESAEEMKLRFSVYKKNLGLIRSTNKKGLSYKLSINKFADLTRKEFQRHNLVDAKKYSAALVSSRKLTESAALVGSQKLTVSAIPLTKDWRKDGIVSPVKQQGSCGSSWAFSATGALEAAYHQAFGKGTDLSEQQLVDCSKDFGCYGGLPSQAFRYIKDNGGIVTENAYVYNGREGSCRFNRNVTVKLLDYVSIPQGAELELLRAVGLVRPVSVGIHEVDDFQFYSGGVFTSLTCPNTLKDANHYVLAVGYGFENGVPYWLLKNSWGREWGESGYFKILRGTNMCGVATNAVYPVVA